VGAYLDRRRRSLAEVCAARIRVGDRVDCAGHGPAIVIALREIEGGLRAELRLPDGRVIRVGHSALTRLAGEPS